MVDGGSGGVHREKWWMEVGVVVKEARQIVSTKTTLLRTVASPVLQHKFTWELATHIAYSIPLALMGHLAQ